MLLRALLLALVCTLASGQTDHGYSREYSYTVHAPVTTPEMSVWSREYSFQLATPDIVNTPSSWSREYSFQISTPNNMETPAGWSREYSFQIVLPGSVETLAGWSREYSFQLTTPANVETLAGWSREYSFQITTPTDAETLTAWSREYSYRLGLILPNLIAKDVSASVSDGCQTFGPETEETVSLTYTVENVGSGPTASGWVEAVYVTAIGLADVKLGEFPFERPLAAALSGATDSYTRTVSFPLPGDEWGDRCVRIRVIVDPIPDNGISNVLETDEVDNSADSAEQFKLKLRPQPDLVVDANIQPPPAIVAGLPFDLAFTVRNDGEAPTDVGTRKYAVFGSAAPCDVSGTPLAVYTTSQPLPPSPAPNTDSVTLSLTLPPQVVGSYYLSVYADWDPALSGGTVTEGEPGGEDNNCQSIQISVLPVAAADLQGQQPTPVVVQNPDGLNSADAPIVRPGATYLVEYFATNPSPPNADYFQSWIDSCYFSTQPTPLDSVVRTLDGAAGNYELTSYSGTFVIQIPDDAPAGAATVLVVLNDSGTLFEGSPPASGNNTLVLDVEVQHAPTDLAITATAPQPPLSLSRGANVSLMATITNVLDPTISVPTPGDRWIDRVFVVQNGVSFLVASHEHVGALPPGGSYDVVFDIEVPWLLPLGVPLEPGSAEFVIDTNLAVSPRILEQNDPSGTNNTANIPFTVLAAAADLQIVPGSVSTSATTLTAGEVLIVSVDVLNAASGPDATTTSTDRWLDSIVLENSSGAIVDGTAETSLRIGDLAPGDAYTTQLSLRLPIDLPAGDYTLVVRTDNSDPSQPTAGAVIESDDDNNTDASVTLTVNAADLPNLEPDLVSVPASALAGQPISVSWLQRCLNCQAAVGLGSWSNEIYLSEDDSWGPEDRRIGGVSSSTADHANGTSDEASLSHAPRIPLTITGFRYVIVVTDRFDRIPESDENDNWVASGSQVFIDLPPPVDLRVDNISVPPGVPTFYIGELMAPLSRTIKNHSSEYSFTGSVTDGLFFRHESTGQLAGGGFYNSGELFLEQDPLASSAVTLPFPDIVVPLVPSEGNYFIEVETDTANVAFETDESNNRTTSTDRVHFAARPLPADNSEISLAANAQEFRLFKIETGANCDGETLEVELTHTGTPLVPLTSTRPVWVDLTARRDVIPTPLHYDVRANALRTNHQTLRITDCQPSSSYYVLVRVFEPFDVGDFVIQARILDLAVTDVYPSTIGSDGRVTVEIRGSQFPETLTLTPGCDPTTCAVSIQNAAGALTPTSLVRIDAGLLLVELELNDALQPDPLLNIYDVTINTGSDSATAVGVLTVQPTVPATLDLAVSSEAVFRAGDDGVIEVVATNIGNVDAAYATVSHRLPLVPGRLVLGVDASTDKPTPAGEPTQWSVAWSSEFLATATILARSLPPGRSVTVQTFVEFEGETDVVDALEYEAPIGQLSTAHAAAVLSEDEAITMLQQLAEEARLALLADPDLLAVTPVATLGVDVALSDDWELLWFADLVQAGVVSTGSVPSVGSGAPSSPVTPIAAAIASGCAAIVDTEATVADHLASYAAFVQSSQSSGALVEPFLFTASPTEALVALEQRLPGDWDAFVCTDVDIRASFDPNDKTPGSGVGPQRYISRQRAHNYTINFENRADTNFGAPAARVEIRDPLGDEFLIGQVQLNTISFAGCTIEVPPGQSFFSTIVDDLLPTTGVLVQVTGLVDPTAREVRWELQALDPNTLVPPTSGLVGFLNPEDGSGIGSGHVSFNGVPGAPPGGGTLPLPDDYPVPNEATITFDANAAILTPLVFNTVDANAPTSDIDNIGLVNSGNSIQLSWSGDDPAGGLSGVRDYCLYVAETCDGPWTPLLVNSTLTSYEFTGPPGQYFFYTEARDLAGNREYLDEFGNPVDPPLAPESATISGPPVIDTNPAPIARCVGETASFEVIASGADPLSYRWRFDGVEIAGATSPLLELANVQQSDAGLYSVTVSNSFGSVESALASLTIELPPQINSTSPALVAQNRCLGDMLTLCVDASGDGNLSYTWFRDGVEVSGAMLTCLNLSLSTPASAGVYTVEVSNHCGSTTAVVAEVTLLDAPALTQHPQNLDLCVGESESLSVAIQDDTAVTYQWFQNGTAVPGATLATLELTNVTLSSAGDYFCRVTNPCAAVDSGVATVNVSAPAGITCSPLSQEVCEGEAVTLTVCGVGTPQLSYLWRKDGQPIAGAVADTLTIPSVNTADVGSYDCVVSNACGSATSAAAALTVNTAPTVVALSPDQTECEGESVELTVMADGTPPLTYQWAREGINIPGATNATHTIPAVDSNTTGSYSVTVTNVCGSATGQTTLSAHPLLVISMTPQSQSVCEGQLVMLTVVASGADPVEYEWRFNGVAIPGETGSELLIAAATSADAGIYDVIVTDECSTLLSATATLDVILTGVFPCDCNGNGVADSVDVTQGTSLDTNGNGIPDECEEEFLRGDVNDSGGINLQDAILLFEFLFLQGTANCLDALDFDDSANLDLVDPVLLLHYLFNSGTPPSAPFPSCGLDPTPDTISCDNYVTCP